MEKLNELVELAKEISSKQWFLNADEEVTAIDNDAGPDDSGEAFIGCAANIQLANYIAAASPENILAIAEAFRALEQRAEAAEAKLEKQGIIPDGLHPSTAELVLNFAKALAEKLHRSEEKYGWSDGWKDADWQEKCLADFHHHISKGDPRDVAAYCAFMWHHEWPTRPAPALSLAELLEVTKADFAWIDAVPPETMLPVMPGIDRDWADSVLRNIEGAK